MIFIDFLLFLLFFSPSILGSFLLILTYKKFKLLKTGSKNSYYFFQKISKGSIFLGIIVMLYNYFVKDFFLDFFLDYYFNSIGLVLLASGLIQTYLLNYDGRIRNYVYKDKNISLITSFILSSRKIQAKILGIVVILWLMSLLFVTLFTNPLPIYSESFYGDSNGDRHFITSELVDDEIVIFSISGQDELSELKAHRYRYDLIEDTIANKVQDSGSYYIGEEKIELSTSGIPDVFDIKNNKVYYIDNPDNDLLKSYDLKNKETKTISNTRINNVTIDNIQFSGSRGIISGERQFFMIDGNNISSRISSDPNFRILDTIVFDKYYYILSTTIVGDISDPAVYIVSRFSFEGNLLEEHQLELENSPYSTWASLFQIGNQLYYSDLNNIYSITKGKAVQNVQVNDESVYERGHLRGIVAVNDQIIVNQINKFTIFDKNTLEVLKTLDLNTHFNQRTYIIGHSPLFYKENYIFSMDSFGIIAWDLSGKFQMKNRIISFFIDIVAVFLLVISVKLARKRLSIYGNDLEYMKRKENHIQNNTKI